MRIAIVGCGFVADLYMLTLPLHPELELVGVMDRNPERARRFSETWGSRIYASFEELLDDRSVELVLNLTNPTSHYEVSRACLLAGKHVYSEKPLASKLEEAEALVELAEERGLYLSGAPSRLLGDTAQTMWKALRENAIGQPLLAYAEMDDGLVHRMAYKKWISRSGAPWPYIDEFQTGCTVEHAGYCLTWLAAFFGPAESVAGFSAVAVRDKKLDEPLAIDAPDFSVACIRFASGMIARMTNSIVAPEDHSIRIFGEDGVLSVEDCWKPAQPVHLKKRIQIAGRSVLPPVALRAKPVRDPYLPKPAKPLKKVDYCLGPVELVNAVRDRRPSRLSARFCLHITELTLATHESIDAGRNVVIKSRFDPIAPMPWAV